MPIGKKQKNKKTCIDKQINKYLKTRKDRCGVGGAPGRGGGGLKVGSTVAQLVLVTAKDLLVGARLCSVRRHGQLHFSDSEPLTLLSER